MNNQNYLYFYLSFAILQIQFIFTHSSFYLPQLACLKLTHNLFTNYSKQTKSTSFISLWFLEIYPQRIFVFNVVDNKNFQHIDNSFGIISYSCSSITALISYLSIDILWLTFYWASFTFNWIRRLFLNSLALFSLSSSSLMNGL